jgi:hypothetical protein
VIAHDQGNVHPIDAARSREKRLPTPDLQDVMVFGGLMAVGAGIAMLSVPWSLVVVGGMVMGIGLFAR